MVFTLLYMLSEMLYSLKAGHGVVVHVLLYMLSYILYSLEAEHVGIDTVVHVV